MSGLHKDFHGYHSFILQYVQNKYGDTFLEQGLRRIGRTVYAPMAEALAEQGLDYFENYWKELFEAEGCDVRMCREGNTLVLEVTKCPAIEHLHGKNMHVAQRFCEHTRIVNEEICRAAGYECSTEYDQDQGRCVQRFWKRASAGEAS